MNVIHCIETRRPCLVISYGDTLSFIDRVQPADMADWMRIHDSGYSISYDYEVRAKAGATCSEQSQCFVFPDMDTLMLFRLTF